MTDRAPSGRTYTNVALTVIAGLLAVQVVQQVPLGVVREAQAQGDRQIDRSIPATQDVAVAAATNEVAQANRDIAAAIRETGRAIDTLASALRASAAATAAANSANNPRPAGSPSDINISVK